MPKTPLSIQGHTRPYARRLAGTPQSSPGTTFPCDQRLVVSMGALSRLPTGWILTCFSGEFGPRTASRISRRPFAHRLHQKRNPSIRFTGQDEIEGFP